MKLLLKRLLPLYSIIFLFGFMILFFLRPWDVGNTSSVIIVGIGMWASILAVTKVGVINPLNKIQDTVQKIQKGNFGGHLRLTDSNEFGRIAVHLNEMSAILKNRILENASEQNELMTILSSMVEGVIVVGLDERIVLLTQPIVDMLELRSPETIGKPYWEVIRHEEINALLRDALSHKRALRREVGILTTQEAYFSMQISPIVQERDLKGVVAIFHDITELKRLEKIRTEFVANASHELKTPLTSIKGFVETLLESNWEDKATAKRFLNIVQNHTQRLENLVNDLLSLSSIESSDEPWQVEPVRVAEAIENVLNLYRQTIETKHQTVETQIPDALPNILAHPHKIEEVFSNLVDNAVKFTPDGGRILIRASEENGFVRVDVEDSGIGIPPDHLPRIFERFYRVDKARSRELGGTGLGLAIVKHIVQKHNGKIAVQSESEKGTIFSVFLPKATV